MILEFKNNLKCNIYNLLTLLGIILMDDQETWRKYW